MVYHVATVSYPYFTEDLATIAISRDGTGDFLTVMVSIFRNGTKQNLGVPRKVTTDEAGRFKLYPVPASSLSIFANADGNMHSQPIIIAPADFTKGTIFALTAEPGL